MVISGTGGGGSKKPQTREPRTASSVRLGVLIGFPPKLWLPSLCGPRGTAFRSAFALARLIAPDSFPMPASSWFCVVVPPLTPVACRGTSVPPIGYAIALMVLLIYIPTITPRRFLQGNGVFSACGSRAFFSVCIQPVQYIELLYPKLPFCQVKTNDNKFLDNMLHSEVPLS